MEELRRHKSGIHIQIRTTTIPIMSGSMVQATGMEISILQQLRDQMSTTIGEIPMEITGPTTTPPIGDMVAGGHTEI